MKFVVRKLRVAEADALRAAEWYDELQPGLGDTFIDDLDAAVALLVKNPLNIFHPIFRCPLHAAATFCHLRRFLSPCWNRNPHHCGASRFASSPMVARAPS